MQQDPVSVLAIECHFVYILGDLEKFVLALPWISWKYAQQANATLTIYCNCLVILLKEVRAYHTQM